LKKENLELSMCSTLTGRSKEIFLMLKQSFDSRMVLVVKILLVI
jgi:hypothetical protein